jgi:hypothetical protein
MQATSVSYLLECKLPVCVAGVNASAVCVVGVNAS